MDDKEFAKWNEGMFSKYGNERLYYHPNPVIRYIENKRVSTIIETAGPASNVLEVGCGEGYVLKRLKAKRKYGVDISLKALEIAKARTGADVALADAENLPFPDACFEAVVCTEVLEHTRDPAKVISECQRVAVDGGKILLSIPNEKRINALKDLAIKMRLFWLFPGIPKRMDSEWHLHSFDMAYLRGLMPGQEQKKVVEIPRFLALRYVVILENKNQKKKQEVSYLCPECGIGLEERAKTLCCRKCKREFSKKKGFPELLPKGFV
jgi:SAM-dependent methyltransferase